MKSGAGDSSESLVERARRLAPTVEWILAEFSDEIGITDSEATWMRAQLVSEAPDSELAAVLDSFERLDASLHGGEDSRDVVGTATGADVSDGTARPVRFFEGPFSAPPPSGPPDPPPALVAAVPHLPAALAAPDPPLPAIRDWSWRSGEARDERAYMSHWLTWGPVDAKLLEQLWIPDADQTVRDLIERWGWAWPDVGAGVVPAHHPDLATAFLDQGRHHPEHPRAREAFAERWVDTALTVGLHERYRPRISWPDPSAMDCAVCGRRFAPETLSWWMRRFGPPRFCHACCCRAANATDSAVTAKVARQALETLVAHLGFVPPQDIARKATVADIDDPARRDAVMASLVALPTPDRLADSLGVAAGPHRWLRILQGAGLVGDAWRPSRGTLCTASDGHPCRSLGERAVDDWLTAHGIDHAVEPAWPAHPDYNPSGKLRADWQLPNGTYVELAGMLADEGYAARMATKARLANASGIRLVVITPDDLGRLDRILGSMA